MMMDRSYDNLLHFDFNYPSTYQTISPNDSSFPFQGLYKKDGPSSLGDVVDDASTPERITTDYDRVRYRHCACHVRCCYDFLVAFLVSDVASRRLLQLNCVIPVALKLRSLRAFENSWG